MENPSIYAVFERMWQYIIGKFNNYANIEDFDNHIENESNPHGVTKEQIGLADVDNTSDAEKPISNATQEALNEKAELEHEHEIEEVNGLQDLFDGLQANFDSHNDNKANPHEVTAEQVGALPITGGVMEDSLTVRGIILTEGIDYGSGDPGGGVLGQLYFKKVT